MRVTQRALVSVVFVLAVSLALAANGKYHSQGTKNAMAAKGFSTTAQTIAAVGNLKTDIYSSTPKAAQAVTRGPWASEMVGFHCDNLFTSKDVTDYFDNLEKTACKAAKQVVADINANKCSASGCVGHARPNQKHHIWNSTADDLFHNRKKTLLLMMGAILHAVQDFYYHSNWVELWDAAGKGGDIPTLGDARAKGDAESKGILGKTVTGEYHAPKAPANAVSHDDLNKDSPNSPQGKKLAKDGRTNFHTLANRAAAKASEQWIDKFKKCINDDALWGKMQRCDGIGKSQAKDYDNEHRELQAIFQSVSKWNGDTGILGAVVSPAAFGMWQNRCASLSTPLFRGLLKDIGTNNPARKYLAVAPTAGAMGLASAAQAGADLRKAFQTLEAQESNTGEAGGLANQAMASVEYALQSLDEGAVVGAFLHTAQARNKTEAAGVALAAQGADDSVITAVAGVQAALSAATAVVAQVPADVEIWTPAQVNEGEPWTGLAMVKNAVGYIPYEGGIVCNGEVAPVTQGKFTGPAFTQTAAGAVFFGIPELVGSDRKVSPTITCGPEPEDVAPFILSNSAFVHPREPVLVISGEGLNKLGTIALVSDDGTPHALPIVAGSSSQLLCLAPASVPAGTYTLAGQTADDQIIQGPTTVTVPTFTIETTPVTHVGQSGHVTVSSTCNYPVQVEVFGGDPHISLPSRTATVSQGAEGVLPFTAAVVGSYSLIAVPISPARGECAALPLPAAEADALWQGIIANLVDTYGPQVFNGDGTTREWLSGPAKQGAFGGLLADVFDSRTKKQKRAATLLDKLEKEAKEAADAAIKAQKQAEAIEKRLAQGNQTDAQRVKLEKQAKNKRREAAQKFKTAGDKYRQAAQTANRAGDSGRAAKNEENAAQQYRTEGDNWDAGGKKGQSVRHADSRAAAAEQRAAQHHTKAAKRHNSNARKATKAGDHKKAADEHAKTAEELQNAAENFDRAGSDYSNGGDQPAARNMKRNAAGMRQARNGATQRAQNSRDKIE